MRSKAVEKKKSGVKKPIKSQEKIKKEIENKDIGQLKSPPEPDESHEEEEREGINMPDVEDEPDDAFEIEEMNIWEVDDRCLEWKIKPCEIIVNFVEKSVDVVAPSDYVVNGKFKIYGRCLERLREIFKQRIENPEFEHMMKKGVPVVKSEDFPMKRDFWPILKEKVKIEIIYSNGERGSKWLKDISHTRGRPRKEYC